MAFNVGEIYSSNQKIDEALTNFELASKIKPDWPDPYLKMGYVYLNKGDMSKAAEYFEKFLKLEPNTKVDPNPEYHQHDQEIGICFLRRRPLRSLA